LVHFWALLTDVTEKGLDSECEKQRGERVPLLHPGCGFNDMWANVLAGSTAVCHLDIMGDAWTMPDNFFKHAVAINGIESILEIQADNDEVRGILLVCD
jgi:hypothetical protein